MHQPEVRTGHIMLADLAIPKYSTTSIVEALADFVKKYPQISGPDDSPQYLVIGPIAVAALTNNPDHLKGCSDISLMHTGLTEGYRSTPLTWSSSHEGPRIIRSVDLGEVGVKLCNRLDVQCKPVFGAERDILCHILVPHPAVLAVLAAADIFGAQNRTQTSRDCAALLNLLLDTEQDLLPMECGQWRKLIHDTYEGLEGGKRELAHHNLASAALKLAERTGNKMYTTLVPDLGLRYIALLRTVGVRNDSARVGHRRPGHDKRE